MGIGKRLKEARKARGMSQDMLAENIGTSRGVITNIELDKVDDPQAMVINAICNVLNIRKEWLTDGVGSMEIDETDASRTKILSEIHSRAQELSEEEQLFILDMVKSYAKHLQNK